MRNKKLNQNHVRLFTTVLCVMLVTLFFAWTRIQNIRLGRAISRLSSTERSLQLKHDQLKLQWARTTSPTRLEQIGRKQFGLQRPQPDQVFIVKEP